MDEVKEPQQPVVMPKNLMYLRRKPSIKDLVDEGKGRLTDLSNNHEVTIDWRLNPKAKRDHIFKLTIDEKTVYLDLDELLFHTRIMFM